MITDNDLQKLSAYLDDELNERETSQIETRLQQDSELREYLNSMRQSDRILKETMDPISLEKLPSELTDLIHNESLVNSRTDSVPDLRGQKQKWRRPYMASALAASFILALGFLAGRGWQSEPIAPEVMSTLMQPSNELVQMLNQNVSGTKRRIGDRMIILELSFLRRDGVLCRQFLKEQAGFTFHGIACRERGDRWINAVLSPVGTRPEQSAHYQLAGGDNESAVSSYIMNNIEGIPLSIEQEHNLFKR